jgi:hypothetical protein
MYLVRQKVESLSSKTGMSGKNGIVELRDGHQNLGRRRDSKGELRLPSVVDRKPNKEKRAETRASIATSHMKTRN